MVKYPKISEAVKRIWQDPEYRKNHHDLTSKPRGKKPKMSEAAKKRMENPECRAQVMVAQKKAADAIRGKIRVPKETFRCIDCGKEKVCYRSALGVDPTEYRCRACGSKSAAIKNRGRKPSEETRKKQSLANKGKSAGKRNVNYGKSPLNKGVPLTIEQWIKSYEARDLFVWYGAVTYPKQRLTEEQALETRTGGFWYGNVKYKTSMMVPNRRGPRNHHWKGGITTLNHAIRDCARMLQWRQDIFERDHFTCQETGIVGGKLEIHHIVPISELIHKYSISTLDEALKCPAFWELSNGITLTKERHRAKHRRKK